MKKLISLVSGKGSYVLGIGLAALMGGLVSATVLAAVPDSSGTIHGCYRNSAGLLNAKGSLRVIDPSAGDSCASNETALNWSQSGGSSSSTPTVYDSNGQALGALLDYDTQGQGPELYNPSLNRVLLMGSIAGDGTNLTQTFGEEVQNVYFQSSGCTGQPYISDIGSVILDNLKTNLLMWYTTTGGGVYLNHLYYGIVADSASSQSIVPGSMISTDPNNDEHTCLAPDSNNSGQFYALTSASLPFTTPVAEPFKLSH